MLTVSIQVLISVYLIFVISSNQESFQIFLLTSRGIDISWIFLGYFLDRFSFCCHFLKVDSVIESVWELMVSAYCGNIVLWVVKKYTEGIRLHLSSTICFFYSSFVFQICLSGVGIYVSLCLNCCSKFYLWTYHHWFTHSPISGHFY